MQCLVERQWEWPGEWKPAPDDESFESEGHFSLSGLGDRVGTVKDDVVCSPERHLLGTLDPAFGNKRGFVEGDMPFHPYCLEIYRRVSECRTGTIDINGLIEWWERPQEGPITLWHDLMKKELPWIWEAWTDRPYLLMSCATQAELIAHDKKVNE